jgi:hypothetical protein
MFSLRSNSAVGLAKRWGFRRGGWDEAVRGHKAVTRNRTVINLASSCSTRLQSQNRYVIIPQTFTYANIKARDLHGQSPPRAQGALAALRKFEFLALVTRGSCLAL